MIYRALQKHLDKQPVGYPAAKSGADIRLLKRFFTPEEAEIAMKLNYVPRTLEDIYADIKDEGISLENLEKILDAMSRKIVIGYKEKEGKEYFFNIPLVVGMYEGQIYNITPDFLTDFEEYVTDKAFGLELLSSKLPQMRTIPIEKSIRPKHNVATYDHMSALVNSCDGPFVINECICRKTANIKGKPCKQTDRLETCLAIGDAARSCIRSNMGREISMEEALEISQTNEKEGLVLQPNNAQKLEFICACCGCCCGMLQIHKLLPNPLDFWSSNYHAVVDPDKCIGCGACIERCQVNAINFDHIHNMSVVDPRRCIGCGNCVSFCEEEAITLFKKKKEFVPPETTEELNQIIMEHKKGVFGQIKLQARLIISSLITHKKISKTKQSV